MSRHRLVRNMNIQGMSRDNRDSSTSLDQSQSGFTDELDDEAMSDGGDAELTQEDYGKKRIISCYNILSYSQTNFSTD